MGQRTIQPVFLIIIFLIGTQPAWGEFSNPSSFSTIELEKPVHFLGVDGSDVLVSPGTYQLEVTEAWLRLIPGERHEALLLEAQKTTHEEVVTSPTAVTATDGTEEFVIGLLFPDGQGLEAVGLYNGIRSKAAPRFGSRPAPVKRKWKGQTPQLPKPTPLTLRSVSIEYLSLGKTYQGKKLNGKWVLPVSDSVDHFYFILEWAGYQGKPFPQNSVPPSVVDPRKPESKGLCCLTLLIEGKAVWKLVQVGPNGQLQTRSGIRGLAKNWPKTVKLMITRGENQWASATMTIYPNTVSHFATELHPIFSHPRCTTCHSLGDHQAIVAMHQSRLGATNFPDVAKAQPQSPKFCAKCHTVKDWRSPKFVQGLNWGGKTAIQICKKVTGNFIDKNGVVRPPLTKAEFSHHFSGDPRLHWALFDGAKPYGDPPTLPVPLKGDFGAWANRWNPWVHAGTPCPIGPNAPVIQGSDLIPPGALAPQHR